MSYEKNKGRAKNKRYFALPHHVTGHPNYIKLSGFANRLIIDIGRQYYGSNNGDLCATWSLMKERGWVSKETLNDALRELEHYGFIVVTQYGNRKKPTLYAIGWRRIDTSTGECKQLEGTVPNAWVIEKAPFVKPSAKRRLKKSVTRNTGQTGTEYGVKRPKLDIVK